VFEQGPVKVEREKEFGELKSALQRVFSRERVEKFLRQLDKKNVKAREFEKVLDNKLIEAVDQQLADSGEGARRVYDSLAVPDQGLIREFYLSSVDQVESALRRRFQKLFTYY
jgi:hypothetical protein